MRQTSVKWRRWLVAGGMMGIALAARAGPAAYTVVFRNAPERAVRLALRSASESYALRDQPPASSALLLVRGEQDRARVLEVLRSRGYYMAGVEVRLKGAPRKQKLVFDLQPGPLFRLGEVHVQAGDLTVPTPAQLGLRRGRPFRAQRALDAEGALLHAVREQGYPFPELTHREYRLDMQHATVAVVLRVDPGRAAVFGPTAIRGLQRLKETYVRSELAWREGQPFDPRLVEDTHSDLARSGLFSALAFQFPDQVEDDGTMPMEITLRERRRRTISAVVSYKTDEGAGVGTQWEHRNLRGGAEHFRAKALWAEQVQSGDLMFSVPHVYRPNQQLDLSFRLADEQPEAYESRNARLAAAITREWSPRWSGRIGPALRLTRVDQLDEKDNFLLLSLPAELKRDTSDDSLDAQRGYVALLDEEPFYDALAGDVVFLKSTLRGQIYGALDQDRAWVIAARGAVGGLAGASRSELPADELFYAGGGSSIRGYAYQTVGPLVEGEPVGGRSLFEASLEMRWRALRHVGLVAFLDGGTAFAASAPDFDEELLWGTGLGFRYFTPIGPLRVDVGIPLDRRSEIDKSFQVYVSLGQAF